MLKPSLVLVWLFVAIASSTQGTGINNARDQNHQSEESESSTQAAEVRHNVQKMSTGIYQSWKQVLIVW